MHFDPPFRLHRNYIHTRQPNGEHWPVYPQSLQELREWIVAEWRRVRLAGKISDPKSARKIAINGAREIQADAGRWLEFIASRAYVGDRIETVPQAARAIRNLLKFIDTPYPAHQGGSHAN